MNEKIFSYASSVISDREQVVEDIKEKKNLNNYFIANNLVILICTLLYGAILGTYLGGSQILINSVKIPILFFVTLYISLPIFYILNLLLGLKINHYQTIVLLLSGYVIASIIMVAFTPFVLFFILTAKDYHFIMSLTVCILGLSGYFSIIYIFRNFSSFHDSYKWYPSFIIGSFAIIFVGTQLSWTLRPYFHSHDSFIRPVESNFYVNIGKSISTEPVVGVLLLIFILMAILITIFIFTIKKPDSENKSTYDSYWDPYATSQNRTQYPYYSETIPERHISRQPPIKKKKNDTTPTSVEFEMKEEKFKEENNKDIVKEIKIEENE